MIENLSLNTVTKMSADELMSARYHYEKSLQVIERSLKIIEDVIEQRCLKNDKPLKVNSEEEKTISSVPTIVKKQIAKKITVKKRGRKPGSKNKSASEPLPLQV